jgi:hypothetical protein
MSLNTNAVDFIAARQGKGVVEVDSLTDLPAPIGGVITIPTGLYIFKNEVNFGTNRIDITGNSVQMYSENSFQKVVTYEGTGIFITGDDTASSAFRVFYPGITFVLSGDGATFANIVGSSGILFSSVLFTHPNGGHMGSIKGRFTEVITSSRFFTELSGVDGWLTGINLSDGSLSYAERGTVSSHANAVGGFYTLRNMQAPFHISGQEHIINNAQASIFNIAPTNTEDVVIDICTLAGIGNFYHIGETGTFSAVADASIASEAITSVQDDGSGNTQFNHSAVGGEVFVGQVINTSTFGIHTEYNGSFPIIAAGAGFAVIDLDFLGNDTGIYSTETVTMTDTGTILVDGDIVLLDTDDALNYDGGFDVFNQLTNSFEVDAEFSGTKTGTWDTSGLDQTAPSVRSTGNTGSPDSEISIEMRLTGNVAVTSIPAISAKVLIASSPWTDDTAERLKRVATGNAVFKGLQETAVSLGGSVTLEPANSTHTLSCQFAREDAARVVITFVNGTNTIVDTATTREDGDNITFHDTEGVLPAALRDDILYFIINKTVNGYQVSYTLGGAAVTFVDDGSGTNTCANADLHGSLPSASIAANSPQSLELTAVERIDTGDRTYIIVSNDSGTADIEVLDSYFYIKG